MTTEHSITFSAGPSGSVIIGAGSNLSITLGSCPDGPNYSVIFGARLNDITLPPVTRSRLYSRDSALAGVFARSA